MLNLIPSKFRNQKGAMFGLDARIALAIFSGLTVIAGVTLSAKISDITGSALVDETKKLGLAVEGMQLDLKFDIFRVLNNPSESNAFAALYDNEMLRPGKAQGRWLGPYIDLRDNIHPSYGEMFVYKRAETHKEVCRAGSTCYLWLVMNTVPFKTLENVNEAYDGRDESIPETKGRIQWQASTGNNIDEERVQMWYRISRSM